MTLSPFSGKTSTVAQARDETGCAEPSQPVVKVWNTVGHAHMFRPDFPGGPPDMLIAGKDGAAKQQVTKLLSEFGWNTVDTGGIELSRYLEGMCLVWVLHGIATGSWNHAFKLLRK